MLNALFQSTHQRIAGFHEFNGVQLANSFTRLASGKNVQTPKDNIGDYFRADKIYRENRTNSIIRRDLGEALAMISVAEDAGTSVFDDMSRMKELVTLYWNGTPSDYEKTAYQAEFDALKNKIVRTIDNSYYDDRKLVADTGATPLRSITINPYNLNDTISIEFDPGDVADTAMLDITGPSREAVDDALQAEMNKAASYLAKISAYTSGLNAQYAIVTQRETVNEEVSSMLVDSDMGKEMAAMVDRTVRQQMSLAMLAQGNMFSSSVLMLFE